MAVGTNIIWDTEPVMTNDTGTSNENGPLFLACFTSSKGPEDLRIVTGDFDKLYGTDFSFAKYGQPLLQARRIISAGGRLLCRRLMPEDATYGNLIIAASVEENPDAQKTDANGNKIYVNAEGIEYPETDPLVTEESIANGTMTPVYLQVQKTDVAGKLVYADANGVEYSETDPLVTEEAIANGTMSPVYIHDAKITYHALSEEELRDPKVIDNLMKKSTLEVGVDADGDGTTDSVVTGTETQTVQKTDEAGNKIYVDAEGIEYPETDPLVTEESIANGTMTPVMVEETIEIMGESTMSVYPLFAVVDNGRGVTGKRVRINIKSVASKTNHQAIYTMTDVENSSDVKTVTFTLDPDAVFENKSYAISKKIHPQFICSFSDSGYLAFVEKVAEISGLDVDYLRAQDLLFGKTYKGEQLAGVVVDNSLDLSYTYGLELQNGSDGAEDITVNSVKYDKMTADFFAPAPGTAGEDIYNTDIYKIDAVADANYSFETKNKIVELAEFRKDFFFFRDLGLGEDGLGLTTYLAVENVATDNEKIKPTKFAANYCTSYEVVDPFTGKPIHVTCIYSLVDHIINHFISARHLPFAGYKITDYIEGTIDFIPKKTPHVDQKELMENINVNCISFINLTDFRIETMDTATPVSGQLNYIQNVLAVQNVIKDIRTYCPANRMRFNGSDDFDEYANDISENVLVQHMTNFKTLEFVYDNEDVELSNNEFNAALIFSFNRHIQSETFSIYAKD